MITTVVISASYFAYQFFKGMSCCFRKLDIYFKLFMTTLGGHGSTSL